MAQDSLQEAHVGGETAGELSGPPIGEETRRHREELGEQLLTQTRNRPLSRRAQQVGLAVVEHRLDGEQSQEQDGNPVQQLPPAGDERRIEQLADNQGKASEIAALASRHAAARVSGPGGGEPGARAGTVARAMEASRPFTDLHPALDGLDLRVVEDEDGRPFEPVSERQRAVDSHGHEQEGKVEQGVLVHLPGGRRYAGLTQKLDAVPEEALPEHARAARA